MNTRLRRWYRRAYHGLNNRLTRVAGGRLAGYRRPGSIALLLTERCNARCVHCDIWKNRGKEDSLSFDQWKGLLDDLRRWLGPVEVLVTGGEALLVPFTPEVVAHAVGLGLAVEVLSHGYWLDQSRLARMASANPAQITISCDGLGATHDRVRGRDGFFAATGTSIETLKRLRREQSLGYRIRLKTVIMSHNFHALEDVARFADQPGMEVLFQPIEQNYNSPDDPRWFEHSPNWPADIEGTVAAIRRLIEMKRHGAPIANTIDSLEGMIRYFRDPDSMQTVVQAHTTWQRPRCSALSMLQIQSNGDVTVCPSQPPVGNVKHQRIRRIWTERPAWWRGGCCFERRMSDHEKATVGLTASRNVTAREASRTPA